MNCKEITEIIENIQRESNQILGKWKNAIEGNSNSSAAITWTLN